MRSRPSTPRSPRNSRRPSRRSRTRSRMAIWRRAFRRWPTSSCFPSSNAPPRAAPRLSQGRSRRRRGRRRLLGALRCWNGGRSRRLLGRLGGFGEWSSVQCYFCHGKGLPSFFHQKGKRRAAVLVPVLRKAARRTPSSSPSPHGPGSARRRRGPPAPGSRRVARPCSLGAASRRRLAVQ